MKVGINGMGRMGRLALRAAMGGVDRPGDDPRAANRLASDSSGVPSNARSRRRIAPVVSPFERTSRCAASAALSIRYDPPSTAP